MPSGTDFFNQLQAANSKLDTLNAQFSQLLTLTAYTTQALFQNALQNDTIICVLEKISKQTCELLNQSCLQTPLQRTIQKNSTTLAELFAATHAEAALIREREQVLREEIEKCCPPKPVEPCCHYETCPAPGPIPEPPPIIVTG
ncbi:MAG TPA: hypothetical protein VH575_06630 [Gemmataceae bacterium]|jgi:hypothetical protein